jgi:hypothetical protein
MSNDLLGLKYSQLVGHQTKLLIFLRVPSYPLIGHDLSLMDARPADELLIFFLFARNNNWKSDFRHCNHGYLTIPRLVFLLVTSTLSTPIHSPLRLYPHCTARRARVMKRGPTICQPPTNDGRGRVMEVLKASVEEVVTIDVILQQRLRESLP